jgi:hypothetical protein
LSFFVLAAAALEVADPLSEVYTVGLLALLP